MAKLTTLYNVTDKISLEQERKVEKFITKFGDNISELNNAKFVLNSILHAYSVVFTEQIIKCYHKNCPRQLSDSSSSESSIVFFLVFVLVFFLDKF